MLKNKIQITVMENGRQRAVGARVGLTTTTTKKIEELTELNAMVNILYI